MDKGRVAAACMLLLFAAAATGRAAAGEAAVAEAYTLWYPPLAVLQACNPDALAALQAHPLYLPGLERLAGHWRRLPLLGRLQLLRLATALRARKAGRLTLILPPPAPPREALLVVRMAGMEQAAARLAFLRAAGATAGGVWHGARAGELVLASSRQLLADFLHPQRRPLPGAAWRLDLARNLASPLSGLRAWINLPWLANVLEQLQGVTLASDLRGRGVELPPGLSLGLRVRGTDYAWDLCVRLRPGAPAPGVGAGEASVSGTGTGGQAAWKRAMATLLPATPELLLALDARTLRALGGMGLWPGAMRVAGLFAPESASGLQASLGGFRLLTGLHPDISLLRLLAGRVLIAAWRRDQAQGAAQRRWAVLARVAKPRAMRAAVLRALAWFAFFAREQGRQLRVSPLAAVTAAGEPLVAGNVRGAGVGLSFCLLPDGWFLLARRSDDLRVILERLGKGSPPPAPGAALAWSCAPRPATLAALGARLGGELAVCAPLLQAEAGELHATPSWLRLRAQGRTSPLLLAGALAWAAKELAGESGHGQRGRVEPWLRVLLAAQQTYRYLDLGRLNGGALGYASSLPALVAGKGGDGKPLAGMFNRLYDFSDQGFTFAQMARMRVIPGGYAVRVVRKLKGGRVDLSRRLLLLALPRDRERPAYLLDQDGRLRQGRLQPREVEALPDLACGLERFKPCE